MAATAACPTRPPAAGCIVQDSDWQIIGMRDDAGRQPHESPPRGMCPAVLVAGVVTRQDVVLRAAAGAP